MAKTKALNSFAVTAKLMCAFVFAYADCWFSHAAAHIPKYYPLHKVVQIKIHKENISLDRIRLNL